jgi:nitrite reductase (NADH) large subunit
MPAMKACTKAGTTCGGCVPLVTQVMKASWKSAAWK